MENVIKLAVVSDLHCHPTNVNYGSETFLKSDLLRSNIGNHPVAALVQLIKNKNLNADLVICPGDFSNRADVQGFISAWDHVLEISQELQAKQIIATIGNHDIPSRDSHTLDLFATAKGIGKNFPIKDQVLLSSFWDKGFCIIEDDTFDILVINSVKFHTNQQEIDRGRITDEQLNEIKGALLKNQDNTKIKLALCHHHPIPHERLGLGSHDLMILGSELINLLNEFKFDLLIHGHKHDPWLRYSGGLDSLPVFSSGSFSSTEQILFADRRNTFHIITIKKNGGKSRGIIETYEFYQGKGWQESKGTQSIPYLTGFGANDTVETICGEILTLLGSSNLMEWKNVTENIDQVSYITFQQQLDLEEQLLNKDLKLVPKLPSSPEYIIKQ